MTPLGNMTGERAQHKKACSVQADLTRQSYKTKGLACGLTALLRHEKDRNRVCAGSSPAQDKQKRGCLEVIRLGKKGDRFTTP